MAGLDECQLGVFVVTGDFWVRVPRGHSCG